MTEVEPGEPDEVAGQEDHVAKDSFGRFERCAPEEVGFDASRLAQIGGVCDRYIDGGRTAGVVTAVLRDGAVAWVDARGSRDIRHGSPMSVDTLFRIYSMSKPITSAAIMLLVERTRIRLTDPLSRFFPEFGAMRVYSGGEEPPFATEPAAREITVRDLLTHTSGLVYGIGDQHPLERHFGDDFWDAVGQDRSMTLRQMAERIATYPLAHHPGTHWRYSVAIDVLGALIEEVAQIDLGAFLRDRFFDPLGMVDTFFTVPAGKQSRLAAVYSRSDSGLEPVDDPPVMAFTRENSHPEGGGGLVSTAADYAAFAQMLLDGGRATDSDGSPGPRILAPRTVEMMMSDHFPSVISGWPEPGVGFGYGGQVVTDASQLSAYGSVGRFGWGGAASTLFWVDPRERLVGIVLQQIMPYTSDLQGDVATSVYQAIVE